jgi:glutathione reductase (NADPH)
MADEHFDYLVIGGGSGGIASARRAAMHGAKVGLIERSRLGGTCVNVGCVPKKIMFMAGSIQEIIHQAAGYGFKIDGHSFDLADLKKKRDAYVARLNGIYANNLKNSNIVSITGDATFVGERTVKVGDKTYSGDHVLIAVGGKPLMPDIPGIELAIESNDFFDLEKVPKRVAVVGSGYIAVELAGILQILGAQVDLLIRGDRPLRTMEPDIVDLLKEEMEASGLKYIRGEVSALSAASDGTKTLAMKSGDTLEGYDEVLFAIGRVPVTDSLNLDVAGVETAERGEIVVDALSRTSAPNTYAVGDIIKGGIQLTPVAIAAGRLLSDRLFNNLPEDEAAMDYDMVPTVVFSHPPLAVMGLTEAQAIERYGADQVTVHKSTWVNMQYSREFLVEGHGPMPPKTRAKLVCVGPEQRVIGLHMIGLNVDEMLQGFGVAMKLGATKADFDSIVAIHPTSSEEVVTIQPWQPKYKP